MRGRRTTQPSTGLPARPRRTLMRRAPETPQQHGIHQTPQECSDITCTLCPFQCDSQPLHRGSACDTPSPSRRARYHVKTKRRHILLTTGHRLTTTMPAAAAQRKDAREEFRLPNIQITKHCSLIGSRRGWDQMHRLVRFVHGYGAGEKLHSRMPDGLAAGSWVTPINWSRFITAANGRRSAGHLPTCRGRLGTWQKPIRRNRPQAGRRRSPAPWSSESSPHRESPRNSPSDSGRISSSGSPPGYRGSAGWFGSFPIDLSMGRRTFRSSCPRPAGG